MPRRNQTGVKNTIPLPDVKEPNCKPTATPRHQPLTVTRVVLTEMQDQEEGRPQFCRKCENNQRDVLNGSSIHSTLAYSRCRCHRFIKYRIQRRTNDTSIENNRFNRASDKDGLVLGNGPRVKLKTIGLKSPSRVEPMEESVVSIVGKQLEVPSLVKNSSPAGKLLTPRRADDELPSLPTVSMLPEIESPSKQQQQQQQQQRIHKQRQQLQSGSGFPTSKLPHITSHKLPILLPNMTPEAMKPLPPLTSRITELVGLVKFIDSSKRKQLREQFREIDKNGDGHITWAEFLSSLPESKPATISLLKQLYVGLSDATYFGCREFILSSCVAERLNKSTKAGMSADFTVEFLARILSPFMSSLAKLAIEGNVTPQNIKDSVDFVNRELGENTAVSFSSNHLSQVTIEGKCNILDCFALASYALTSRHIQ